MIVLAIFFAYLINPLVELIRKPFAGSYPRLMPRSLAIGLSFLLVFSVLAIGIYYLVSVDGRDFAGAFNKPSGMPGPPGWLGYVRVKNVENTVKAAKKAGGTLINGPMEVPGGSWIVQVLDPQGAMFALVSAKA